MKTPRVPVRRIPLNQRLIETQDWLRAAGERLERDFDLSHPTIRSALRAVEDARIKLGMARILLDVVFKADDDTDEFTHNLEGRS